MWRRVVRARFADRRAQRTHVRSWRWLRERQLSVPARVLLAAGALALKELAQLLAQSLLVELVRHARYTARGARGYSESSESNSSA